MPGDLGSDMGNAGVSFMANLAQKVIDTVLGLLKKLFELWEKRTSVEYKLNKEKLKEQQEKNATEKAYKKVAGKAGFIRHKELQKAGVPLTATGVKCDEKDLARLSEACKRNGIIITAQDDVRSRELGGKRMFVIECRQSDLSRFADLVDSLNDAARIANLEAEKQAVLSLGDAMTEEDKLYIEQLDQEILAIREGRSEMLNAEQAKGAIEQAVDGKTYSGVTLSEALDRWTGGEIDKDTTCYVVDAKDPDKYIVVTATQAHFDGKDYIKSTYDVYNGDKQVFSTNDGRFEGRTVDYWTKQKEAIRTEGGIGDTVIKFYSREEMEAYRETYLEQNAEELADMEQSTETKDYSEIKEQLTEKMKECGAVYEDGKAIDAETGEPMQLTEGMSMTEQANVAEATVCAKQIENYSKMEQLQTDIVLAKAEVLQETEGTPEHARAVVKLETLENKFKAAEQTEAALIDERKGVNFVQSEQLCREGNELTAERQPEIGVQKPKQKMADIKAEIGKAKQKAARVADAGKTKATDKASTKATVKKVAKGKTHGKMPSGRG